jgi:hypothetical protein
MTDVRAVNLGLESFADALRDQGTPVVHVDWRPPADGDRAMLDVLTRLWGRHGKAVEQANAEAVRKIEACQPAAVTVAPARSVIGVLDDGVLLHSGPPITWERVCDPQRRALIAAVLFEGWASSREEAIALFERGELTLASGNEHNHVGPMTGVCSPSMPVWVVEDGDVRAFSTLNEGPGRTLWFGVGDDESVERLRFFRDDLGPRLARMLEHRGPIDIFGLAAQGLNMGDELHMRSQATGNLLIRELAPSLAVVGGEQAARFIAGNHHFFLNLTMAASKCASLASATPGSSIVSLMSRNGTDVGIQLAGMPGRWFVAPAADVGEALLREGNEPEDAAKDIGDSAVIECIGLGGMAVAAAPAVAAEERGVATPVGIDARMVVDLGITPQITTGVLHASAGSGQIGAGVAHQPVEPFRDAIAALADELDAEAASGP